MRACAHNRAQPTRSRRLARCGPMRSTQRRAGSLAIEYAPEASSVVQRGATWCDAMRRGATDLRDAQNEPISTWGVSCGDDHKRMRSARQESGAGRRTIRPRLRQAQDGQVPSPRSSLPDPLSSPLFPFPHSSPPAVKGGNAKDIVAWRSRRCLSEQRRPGSERRVPSCMCGNVHECAGRCVENAK